MLIRRVVLWPSLMLLSIGAIVAQPASQLIQPMAIHKNIYSTISAGLDFIRTNGGQGLVLLPPSQDYYTGHYAYKASGSLGLGLGLERAVRPNWSWQLGLAGYLNSTVQASGHRWEFSSPDFDNFSYCYQIQSSRVVAAGKLLGTYQQKYHPYLSGELGMSFNRAFGYSETSLVEEELPMEPFSSRTRSNLSWGLGLGVDMDISRGLRLGVGYQFADLGKVSLGRSSAQETDHTLSISHLYDNQARIQLTALI